MAAAGSGSGGADGGADGWTGSEPPKEERWLKQPLGTSSGDRRSLDGPVGPCCVLQKVLQKLVKRTW